LSTDSVVSMATRAPLADDKLKILWLVQFNFSIEKNLKIRLYSTVHWHFHGLVWYLLSSACPWYVRCSCVDLPCAAVFSIWSVVVRSTQYECR